jgi:microcystin-dependent protein
MAWTSPITISTGNVGTAAHWNTYIRDNGLYLFEHSVPTGGLIAYAGSAAPSGWLVCNGTAVSRTTYADLFAAISTTFGVGDSSTTFNIPDLRGRSVVGVGTGAGDGSSGTGNPTGTALTARSLSAWGGKQTHTLATSEIPAHGHTQDAHGHGVTDPGHEHGMDGDFGNRFMVTVGSSSINQINDAPSGQALSYSDIDSNTTGLTVNNATATNQNTGGGGEHNIMHPFAALNYLIKI